MNISVVHIKGDRHTKGLWKEPHTQRPRLQSKSTLRSPDRVSKRGVLCCKDSFYLEIAWSPIEELIRIEF